MNTHQLENHAQTVTIFVEKLSTQVAEFAEEFRLEYLVPFCTKYNLYFRSGNGAWVFFTSLNKSAIYEDDCGYDKEGDMGDPKPYCEELTIINTAMTEEVFGRFQLGEFMNDVD